MDSRISAAISFGNIADFLKEYGTELKLLVKQLSKSDKDWKEAVDKEQLFLIQFAFYWKTKYNVMGETEFAQMMQVNHTKFKAEQGIAVVNRNPVPAAPKSSAPKRPIPPMPQAPAVHAIDVPPTTSEMPATSAGTSNVATRPAPIAAGPSNLRAQRPANINRDEELARHLQAAFEENEGRRSFQDLDQTDGSMDEGDDGSESDAPVGKGKGKSKKGKRKASDVKGKRPPVPVPTQSQPPAEAPKGRPIPVRTGELFPYPCDLCVKRHLKCEKIVGGDNCYTCRKAKRSCSHLNAVNPRRVKSRPVPHTTEHEMPPAIEEHPRAQWPVAPPTMPPVLPPRNQSPHQLAGRTPLPVEPPSKPPAVPPTADPITNPSPPRPAARKRSKRTLITSAEEQDSDDFVLGATSAPAKKKRRAAVKADIINAETGRLVQAVEKMDKSTTKRKVAGKRRGNPREEAELKDIVDNYIRRVERIDDTNQEFSNLTQLLGDALAERTAQLQRRSDMLQSVAVKLFQLADERLHQQSAVQRRQNVILESIMTLITQGLPAIPEVWKSGMRIDDVRSHWRKIMDEEAKLMDESMQGRRMMLSLLQSYSQPLDHIRHSTEMNQQEDTSRLNVQAILAQARGMADEGQPERTSMDISDDEGDVLRRIQAIKAEHNDTWDLTGDLEVPAAVAGQTFDVEPVPETELDVTSSIGTSEAAPSGRSDGAFEPQALPPAAAITEATAMAEDALPPPVVNLVSATPMNSQDTAAGTITTLHIPPAYPPPSRQDALPSPPCPPPSHQGRLPSPVPSQLLQAPATTSASRGASAEPSEQPQRRGRSRTPLPPTSMITRSRSRGT